MMKLTSIYEHYLWGYIQEVQEDGMTDTFNYCSDILEIKYSFIKRKAAVIDNVQYYDIVTARGECGPIISFKKEIDVVSIKKEIKKYISELNKFLNDECIIAELIRFSPWNDCSEFFKDYYKIQEYGNLYELNLSNDFFMCSFDSKLRNLIRKAQKSGVCVKVDNTGESIDDFIELYTYTAEKNNMSSYYLINKGFIRRYFECLKDRVSIYNAYYDDNLISSAIMLDSNDIRHYHFSANNPFFSRYQGNSFILFQAALDAKEKGLKLLDLGGAKEESGLEKYKLQFVKKDGIFPYYMGKRIVNENIYNTLVDMIGEVSGDYFPAYRRKV